MTAISASSITTTMNRNERPEKRKAHAVVDIEPSPDARKRRTQPDRKARRSLQNEEDDGFQFARGKGKPRNDQQPGEAKSGKQATRRKVVDLSDTPKGERSNSSHGSGEGSTMMDSVIPLSTRDTPMIRKNKELRQQSRAGGHRRSSSGLRGKRASSIGNGFRAVPHPDIDARDFYKHIADDLPDPLRMRQLLAWCARRAFDEQKVRLDAAPPEKGQVMDRNAATIAQVVKQEVLMDLIESRIETSWYHRPEGPPKTPTKPNPQNEENRAKIEHLQTVLERLRTEERQWKALITNPPTSQATMTNDKDIQPEDLSLLRPRERAFWENVQQQDSRDAERVQEWMGGEESKLELQVDKLFHMLHSVRMLGKAAEGFSEQALSQAAEAFDARRERAQEEARTTDVSPRDILRTLSRRSDV